MKDTDELEARQAAAIAKARELKANVKSLSVALKGAQANVKEVQDLFDAYRAEHNPTKLEELQAQLSAATTNLTKSNGLLEQLQDAILNDEPETPPAEPPAEPPPAEPEAGS